MKSFNLLLLTAMALCFFCETLNAQEKELSPYFRIATLEGTLEEGSVKVSEALQSRGFTILGSYNPGDDENLLVIAYTRKDLQEITKKADEGGILASILKIGLKKSGSTVVISMFNPEYLFYGYLRDETDTYLTTLTSIANECRSAMQLVGNDFAAFGGQEEIDDLKDYHYMAFMPYFDDFVELNEFNSFQDGLSVIRKNLDAKKGNTLKVYDLELTSSNLAVFGVGLLDPEDGERSFLPIIGDDNLAAMPYEILLIDNKAVMLHGKFRFALHWPELSMGQFMKISSTPGDVEDFFEMITEE
jgi:hypothetical protein